jgi:hypothetical protein
MRKVRKIYASGSKGAIPLPDGEGNRCCYWIARVSVLPDGSVKLTVPVDSWEAARLKSKNSVVNPPPSARYGNSVFVDKDAEDSEMVGVEVIRKSPRSL